MEKRREKVRETFSTSCQQLTTTIGNVNYPTSSHGKETKDLKVSKLGKSREAGSGNS